MKLFANKKTKWFPLDNAAKIYPPTASATRPHVFSFSALLEEEVCPEILETAVTNVLNHYDTFKTSMKRGAFWYYLEDNKKPFKVSEEKPYYLKPIDYSKNNGYLLEFLYIRNKITAKFFHALTDGSGGFKFFSEVLIEYLRLSGHDLDLEEKIKPIEEPSTSSSADDSFFTYENATKVKAEKIPKPFSIQGTPFEYDGCGLTTCEVELESLKTEAGKYNASVTAYLAAVYAFAIRDAFIKNKPYGNKIVTVLVPCDLRRKYGGKTMRNFTMFARVIIDWAKKDYSFAECVEIASKQIAMGLTKEKLDKLIHDNVKTEKNFFIKIVPLFLKDLIMRAIYSRIGETLQTVNFSNIGKANLPNGVEKYVKKITFCIAPTFSCGHQTGVVGFNDKVFITFARNYVETGIEKSFVRQLTASGIQTKVYGNYWESQS